MIPGFSRALFVLLTGALPLSACHSQNAGSQPAPAAQSTQAPSGAATKTADSTSTSPATTPTPSSTSTQAPAPAPTPTQAPLPTETTVLDPAMPLNLIPDGAILAIKAPFAQPYPSYPVNSAASGIGGQVNFSSSFISVSTVFAEGKAYQGADGNYVDLDTREEKDFSLWETDPETGKAQPVVPFCMFKPSYFPHQAIRLGGSFVMKKNAFSEAGKSATFGLDEDTAGLMSGVLKCHFASSQNTLTVREFNEITGGRLAIFQPGSKASSAESTFGTRLTDRELEALPLGIELRDDLLIEPDLSERLAAASKKLAVIFRKTISLDWIPDDYRKCDERQAPGQILALDGAGWVQERKNVCGVKTAKQATYHFIEAMISDLSSARKKEIGGVLFLEDVYDTSAASLENGGNTTTMTTEETVVFRPFTDQSRPEQTSISTLVFTTQEFTTKEMRERLGDRVGSKALEMRSELTVRDIRAALGIERVSIVLVDKNTDGRTLLRGR